MFSQAVHLPLPCINVSQANERNVIALSAAIRSKPNWWTKAQDPAIVAKWKLEAVGTPVPFGNIRLDENEVQYMLDELSWYATLRDEATGIEVRCSLCAVEDRNCSQHVL